MSATPRSYELGFHEKAKATVVTRGRVVVGRIVRRETGNLHYYSNRRGEHVFFGGEPSVVDAIRAHVAAWGIDAALLRQLVRRDVKFTHLVWDRGGRERDYCCRIGKWDEEGSTRHLGHGEQRFLPFDAFIVRDAETGERLKPWT